MARQERQDRTKLRAQGPHHDVRHAILGAKRVVATEIAGFDGEGAAFAFDDGSAPEKLRHARPIERRRHGQDAQILAQAALAVERKRKPEIGIERALVELVEQHRADAGKLRVVEDHAGEDALGDNLDAGLRPGFRDHARAKPDPLADGLRQGLRHALGGGARGDAARLQHQDFATPEPVRIRQG